MKIILYITLLINLTFLSFPNVAGGSGSDKYYLLYNKRAYELKDFKKGLLLGVDRRYRARLVTHLDTILMYSSKYKVDPVLVISTIWVESAFKTDALSHKGARGLMQVMPATHKWIFGSILKKTHLKETEIEKNIEAGVAYISYLRGIVGNNKEKVMIAYNMGPKYVLDRDKFKFDHDYYRKISKRFDQISRILSKRGIPLKQLSGGAFLSYAEVTKSI